MATREPDEFPPGDEPKAIPPLREEGHASFVQRLQRRFGQEVDPQISLQEDEGGQALEETGVTKGLFLKLSEKDPASLRYRVKGELARGGMGAILRVWDDDLRRNLAMKVLLSRRRREELEEGPPPVDEELLSRFLEEAQVTGQLEHPGDRSGARAGASTTAGGCSSRCASSSGRDLREQILDLVAEGGEGWNLTQAPSTWC